MLVAMHGVDRRVGAPSGALLHRPGRVEGEPGGVDSQLSPCRVRAEGVAHQGEDERLGDAHDRELHADVAGAVGGAADAGHTDPEQPGRHPGECGVDLRRHAGVLAAEPRQRLIDQRLDARVRGERAGGDEGGRIAPLAGRKHGQWKYCFSSTSPKPTSPKSVAPRMLRRIDSPARRLARSA